MAVISAGAMSVIGPGPKQASRDAKRKADLAQMQSALEIYRSDNSGYPQCAAMATNCAPFVITNYLDTVPVDPSAGRRYRYVPTNCSGGFCRNYRICASLEKDYGTASLPTIVACTGGCTTNCNFSLFGP